MVVRSRVCLGGSPLLDRLAVESVGIVASATSSGGIVMLWMLMVCCWIGNPFEVKCSAS